MFLNIRKIGKQKQKFKAKFVFLKIVNQSSQRGVYFKIKIQRGSNQIQAISQSSRKGIARFKTTLFEIPMTLFYQEDQKQSKYLYKKAVIKAYECEQAGKQIRRIGQKQIDISQYANKGKLKMQVELDPEKKTDEPTVTLQLIVQRQPDDSKSVETLSSNNDKKRQEEIAVDQDQNQNERNKKLRERRKQIASQGTPSKLKNQLRVKQNIKFNKSENGDINYLKDNQQNPIINVRKYTNDRNERPKPQTSYNSSQNSQQLSNQFKRQRRRVQKIPQSNRDFQSYTQQNTEANQISQQLKSIKESTMEKQSNTSDTKNTKSELHTQFTQGQSPELQVFLLRKALKQKQTQIYNLKRQNQSYKRTVDKLVQQSMITKQKQKKYGIQKQLQEIKKGVLTKDIKIDKLTTQNKQLVARGQQYQKTILKLRQQLLIERQKVSDIKYKQAYLMQQLFQTGNKQALQQACRFLSV